MTLRWTISDAADPDAPRKTRLLVRVHSLGPIGIYFTDQDCDELEQILRSRRELREALRSNASNPPEQEGPADE